MVFMFAVPYPMKRGRPSKIPVESHEKRMSLYPLFEDVYKELSNNLLIGGKLERLLKAKELSMLLSLPLNEVIMLSVLVVANETRHGIEEREILGFLQRAMGLGRSELRNVLRALKKMGLISSTLQETSVFWHIKRKVVDQIDKGGISYFKALHPKGLENMLEYWHGRILESSIQLFTDEIQEVLEEVLKANQNLNLVKYIENLSVFDSDLEAATMLSICSRFLFDSRPFNLEYFDRGSHFSRLELTVFRKNLAEGDWKPLREGYVQLAGAKFSRDDTRLQLTDKGHLYFLAELDPKILGVIRKKWSNTILPMLKPKDILPVELVFNSDFEPELKKVETLLGKTCFKQYCREFAKTSRMKGITMLFHGAPGCGKTEFVLQLARATNRPIMKVQVTDFMSKWVGESESNLKRVINIYKRLVMEASVAPILFLNECDQIIGKRVNVTDSVDQMSNSLQNILLEELEDFQGILIGTTNLVHNMDRAFERRFLFKLQFPAPNADSQSRIWSALMPSLPQEVIKHIVSSFDFSPSEINNVVKRYRIEKMIFPDTEFETLLRLCKNETFDGQSSKLIGFC
jgi:hypothetical protein